MKATRSGIISNRRHSPVYMSQTSQTRPCNMTLTDSVAWPAFHHQQQTGNWGNTALTSIDQKAGNHVVDAVFTVPLNTCLGLPVPPGVARGNHRVSQSGKINCSVRPTHPLMETSGDSPRNYPLSRLPLFPLATPFSPLLSIFLPAPSIKSLGKGKGCWRERSDRGYRKG